MPAAATRASAAVAGKSSSSTAYSWTGIESSGSVWTLSISVYGLTRTSSTSSGAAARIQASCRSPSSAGPV
jgi:hypothetical protein